MDNIINSYNGLKYSWFRMSACNSNSNDQSKQTFENFIQAIDVEPLGYWSKSIQKIDSNTDFFVKFYNEVDCVIYEMLVTFHAENQLTIHISFYSEFGIVNNVLKKNVFQFVNMKCMRSLPQGNDRQHILKNKFESLLSQAMEGEAS